ncbi:MAG: lytic murein transglycosylase [Sphingomonadales bacterium]|nr:lytic murein transglycosylase [Sphingomonadales bacterium]
MGFAAYKLALAARARRAGVSEATISTNVPWLSLNSRVIQLDHAQPGNILNRNATPPFAPYRREHVTADLINRGRAVYASNWSQLSALKARTGVEPSVPVAIFGHETSYGTVTGGFDLLEALATLAYEGRRRELFEGEFVAALQLLDRGTPRSRLRGSWAGATGYPQFMPTAVLRLATDGDGDGRADIWSNQADAFASIATFLKSAGWKSGVTWGVAVRTPAGLDRAALKNPAVAPRCERVYARHSKWLTMREWRALGVAPVGKSLPEEEPASLLEPDGPNATAYLLTANYRVILEYNCSNFYALSVGLLADAIAGR